MGSGSVYEEFGASNEIPIDLNLKFFSNKDEGDLFGQPSVTEMQYDTTLYQYLLMKKQQTAR